MQRSINSHIFLLKIQISDLRVPSERATLGRLNDTKGSSVHVKSIHHFDNKETQSSVKHFLWKHLTILTNSFISRDVFGLF